MYADTDFILALVKDSDRLKVGAEDVLDQEEEIESSALAVLETIVVLEREGIEDTVEVVGDILEIVDLLYVEEEKILQAALYMKEDDANPFDAFHAALAGDRKIISSDSIYAELGKEKEDLRKD